MGGFKISTLQFGQVPPGVSGRTAARSGDRAGGGRSASLQVGGQRAPAVARSSVRRAGSGSRRVSRGGRTNGRESTGRVTVVSRRPVGSGDVSGRSAMPATRAALRQYMTNAYKGSPPSKGPDAVGSVEDSVAGFVESTSTGVGVGPGLDGGSAVRTLVPRTQTLPIDKVHKGAPGDTSLKSASVSRPGAVLTQGMPAPSTPPRVSKAVVRGPSTRVTAHPAVRRQDGGQGRTVSYVSSTGAPGDVGPAGSNAPTIEHVRAAIQQRLAHYDRRHSSVTTGPVQSATAEESLHVADKREADLVVADVSDEDDELQHTGYLRPTTTAAVTGFDDTRRAVLVAPGVAEHLNIPEAPLTPRRSPILAPQHAKVGAATPPHAAVDKVKITASPKKAAVAASGLTDSPIAPWGGATFGGWDVPDETGDNPVQAFVLHPPTDTFSPVPTEIEEGFPIDLRAGVSVSPRPDAISPEADEVASEDGADFEQRRGSDSRPSTARTSRSLASQSDRFSSPPRKPVAMVSQSSPGHRLLELSLLEDKHAGISSPVWAKRAKPTPRTPPEPPQRGAQLHRSSSTGATKTKSKVGKKTLNTEKLKRPKSSEQAGKPLTARSARSSGSRR